MKKYKVCSLFSGIGGIEQGVIDSFGIENIEVVFASEKDKFAKQAYEYIHNQKIEGDITKVNEEQIPNHDILLAGFPCQAFSLGGRRQGFADTRGTMFFEVERIIKEKKPSLVFLENVKGLVGHDDGKTLEVILESLSNQGYKVDFDVLNSKDHGVPQSRERIYIIGKRIEEGEFFDTEWDIKDKKNLVLKRKKELNENKYIKKFHFEYPQPDNKIRSIEDILETNVDDKYLLSPDKTKNLIERLKETTFEFDKETFLIDDQGRLEKKIKPLDISPTIRREMHGNEPKVVKIKKNELNMVGKADIKGNDSIKRIYHSKGLCPTLTTMGGGHREPKIMIEDGDEIIIRKLTPKECLRIQAFPDFYYERMKELNISDSQIYKMSGNAVSTSTVRAIFDQIKKELI